MNKRIFSWATLLIMVASSGVDAGVSVNIPAGRREGRDNPLDQGGDDCADLVSITELPYYDQGTTVGQGNDFEGADACVQGGFSAASDVIYHFVPQASALYEMIVEGNGFNPVLELRTGNVCPGSTPVACNDDYLDLSARLTLNLRQGQIYYIIIDGWGTEAGEYNLSVAAVDTSCLDHTLTAPGTVTGTTCGAGEDCLDGEWEGEDVVVAVVIPYEADWEISLCASPLSWFGDLTLGFFACCGWSEGYLPADGWCNGHQYFPALHLDAGTYYFYIESRLGGFERDDCGPYVLQVGLPRLPRGRCCYGDLDSLSCMDSVTVDVCDALGGEWHQAQTCAGDRCISRPTCPPGSMVSQRPLFDWEPGWGVCGAEQGSNYRSVDNFGPLTAPITALRFWGLQETYWPPCVEDPLPVQIVFYADAGGVPGDSVCGYSLLLSGVDAGPRYFSAYPYWQFDAPLDPPCPLTQGWVYVAGGGDPDCFLEWLAGTPGDGLCGYLDPLGVFHAYGPFDVQDLAFCLSGAPPCLPPEELVVEYIPATASARLTFVVPADGVYRVLSAEDPNAPYPSGYTIREEADLTAGVWQFEDMAPLPLRRSYVVAQHCAAASSAAPRGALHRLAALPR